MPEILIFTARLINGLITVTFFPFLFRIFQKTKRRFYLLWSIGFLLYGINILLRVFLPFFSIADSLFELLFPFIFVLISHIFIITGIGDLIDKARVVLLSSLVLPLIMVILYFTTRPWGIGWTISLSPFLFVSIALLIIRMRYSASLDLIIVGWTILLLTNTGYALNVVSEMFIEIYAIFAKVVIFMGMTYSRFVFLADDLKRFLISGIPDVYPNESIDHFTLINPSTGQRKSEIQWIIERTKENSLKAIRTILITVYDLISPSDLRVGGLEEGDLYLIRMLPGGRGPMHVFEEHIMTINDDLNELDILFSDIINFSNERGINCEMILYTLSSLIHTHGWKRVYSFMISKIPELKASNVHAYILYYPETHSSKAEIAKFEKLADKTINI